VDVPARAVLVFDGVFLLRESVRELWTLSVYLHVSPAETLRRAIKRDLDLFGSTDEIERRYHQRYLPAQALYRAEARPETTAHVVVDNVRPAMPRIVEGRAVRKSGSHRDLRSGPRLAWSIVEEVPGVLDGDGAGEEGLQLGDVGLIADPALDGARHHESAGPEDA
jgi:hypothetical protein